MNRRNRMLFLLFVVVLLLSLPTAAFAAKRLYQAKLTTGAELHEVIDSNARGSANLAFFPDGETRIQLSVNNLSGAPTAAHLHMPADTTQNAAARITLCGAGPNSPGPCPMTASFSLAGVITPGDLAAAGIPAAQLRQWLDDGLVYINVHTALNPAGEIRGQFALQ